MCRSVDSSDNRTLNQLIGAIGKLMVWADRNLTGYLQQDTWSLNSRLEVKMWEKSLRYGISKIDFKNLGARVNFGNAKI